MKKIILFLLAISAGTTTYSQTAADYETVVSQFQRYYNSNQIDSIQYILSDIMKQVSPLEKTQKMMMQLKDQFGNMQSYRRTKQDKQFTYYKTDFKLRTMTLVMGLDKEKKISNFRFVEYQPEPVFVNNIFFAAGKDTIFGTLTLPEQTGKKVPVVMIIAGSGPTDRDGNQGSSVKTNTYLMIADSLKKAGIASVRYDKRGVGASLGSIEKEEDVRFEDEINDAAGFIKILKQDSRFSKVYVFGHSEGSLIGMVAANKEKPAGFISVAGAGERIDKIIEQQLSMQSSTLTEKATIILDSLAAGYKPKNIDPYLETLFRPSTLPYMISWLKYDPQKEIKKLSGKVLIIQGTTDVQVSVDDAKKLKKAKPEATLKLITGMSHIMKNGPADRTQNIATYTKTYLPLNDEIVPAIVKFASAE